MAEITKITIGLEGDTKAFEEIQNASRQTTEIIERNNKKVRSSYEQVIQELIILSSLPILLSKNSSTFGENVVKAVEKSREALEQINEDVITLYDQLIRDLIIRINTIPIALQNEKTKEVLNDLRDKAEFVLGLYKKAEPFIKMYNSNPELAKFLVLVDLTFILATIGAISAAIAGLPVEATAALFLLLAATIFVAMGGMEQLNKLVESLFQNANNGTQEFKEGVDGVGEALKKLEPFKNGLFSDNENFGAVFGPDDIQDVYLRFQISDLDPNKFISSDFESIAQNVATYLASGAESSTTIKKELNDIEIPEDLTTFGISPSTSKLGQIFNSRTADERKNTARELTERINQESSLREELERTNKTIDDQTKLFPPLSNALAMAGGEASAFTIGQGLMTDGFNGVRISAVNLAEKGINPLTGKASELGTSLEDVFQNTSEGALIFGYTKEELLGLRDVTEEAAKSTENLGENGITAVTDNAKEAGKTLGTMDSSLGNVGDKAQSLDKTITAGTDNIQDYGDTAKRAADGGLTDLEGKVEDVSTAASNLNLAETVKDLAGFDPNVFLPGFLKPLVQADEQVKQVADTFEETSKSAQNSLDELGVFAADIASEINNTFADLIFRGLKGNLDSLSEFWDSTLDAMLDTFAQFAATIISNPIRILLDTVLRGDSGGGGSGGGGDGKGFFGTIGSIFDIGKGFKTIGKGLLKIPGVSSIVDSVTGLFSEGGALAGVGSFLSSALPVVGAIASVLSVAIPIITGLFKKTPRLDIDFDSVKTEMGKRAAFVNEFLDEDFFKDSIAQISVKRSAGLGVGGDEKIKELIQDTLEATIRSVQEIIFQLPSEIAADLNDTLLNAEIDIDTVVAGERLLEFDAKGKKIKEKFEAFINGELSAKFLFAIRDFSEGAFESLGVLPENASAFIDDIFQRFQDAGSREARAAVGQEFLASFEALVDAFNIIEGNFGDAVGQTLNSVHSLSTTLGFDAVPSLDELSAKLKELVEAAELDPETISQYVELRNAIVSLTSEIVNSISGLIGKIQQLNSTIVGFGGAAIDTSGFINQGIDAIMNILSQPGLSLSEQEAFLDQLGAFANQLLAEEQAAFNQAQAARQAAAEAQRRAIESRIDGLERERDKIQEAFSKRIDALNEYKERVEEALEFKEEEYRLAA